MEVVIEKDIMAQLDRLSMNMQRVAEYVFPDSDEIRLWFEKTKAMITHEMRYDGSPRLQMGSRDDAA